MKCPALDVTVSDSDVHLKEFGEPYILLQNPSGGLYQLVKQTGRAGQSHLSQLALEVM